MRCGNDEWSKAGSCAVCARRYARVWNGQNKAYLMWHHAKVRAARLGIPFRITVADIEVPTHCPALGIPLRIGRRASGPHSPSLDRLDPALGYVKGNVVVISNLANRIKTDATSAQILAVGHWLETQGL